MKINTVFLISFLLCSRLFAQTGLNAVVPSPYYGYYFSSFCVSNDHLIGWGRGLDSQNQQGVIITKMDTFGNVLKQNMYLDSILDPLSVSVNWGKIIPTSDGGYAATAATFYRNSALFFKFDQDCNIEFVKEFPDTVNLSNFFYLPLELDDGYLLFGNIQRPNYNDNGFLRKIDRLGNSIWFQYVTMNNFNNVLNDVALLNDSTILVVMNGATSNNDIYNFRTIKSSLILYDLIGNKLNTWISDFEPEIGAIGKPERLECE